MTFKSYCWNIAISIDQFCNTMLGGDPDETLSSRMGKKIAKRECYFCRVVCWLLDKFESDHCKKSIESDEGKDEIC